MIVDISRMPVIAISSVRGIGVADIDSTAEEFLAASWATAAEAGESPLDLGASSFRDLADVEAAARGRGLPWWTTGSFTVQAEDEAWARNADAIALVMASEDAREGPRAFAEKRAPLFRGA